MCFTQWNSEIQFSFERYAKPQLFINNGNGVFSDVTSAAGIGGDIDGVAQGCNLADVNADGFVGK